LSDGIFKDEMRMHSRAGKVQQNDHKHYAAISSLEMQKQKLNEFLLSFNCYHQVTLPIYSHSENRH